LSRLRVELPDRAAEHAARVFGPVELAVHHRQGEPDPGLRGVPRMQSEEEAAEGREGAPEVVAAEVHQRFVMQRDKGKEVLFRAHGGTTRHGVRV
jgi:hypothetical protein